MRPLRFTCPSPVLRVRNGRTVRPPAPASRPPAPTRTRGPQSAARLSSWPHGPTVPPIAPDGTPSSGLERSCLSRSSFACRTSPALLLLRLQTRSCFLHELAHFGVSAQHIFILPGEAVHGVLRLPRSDLGHLLAQRF